MYQRLPESTSGVVTCDARRLTRNLGQAEANVATTGLTRSAVDRPALTDKWLYDRRSDALIVWGWVPLYVVAHLLTRMHTAAADRGVGSLLSWVLLISLLHQPLTLLLVYGDRRQFDLRRALFTWVPPIAIAALVVAVTLHWWFIIPIAGLWQIYHTEQQRYGMLRIYGRKAGYGSPRLDRAILYVPFLLALGAVALLPSTRDQLRRFGATLGGPNVENINTLLSARGAIITATVPVAVATLAVLGLYFRQERSAVRMGTANPAKWHYLVGTGALTVGLAYDPAAGLIAFVAAHALEYVVVVDRTLRSRYASAPAEGRPSSLLSVLAGSRNRRIALLVGFFAVFAVVDLQLRGVLAANVYLVVVYTIGLLHFLYDGFIWKTRRPAVAADFGVPPARV
jgi:hypothetical protein